MNEMESKFMADINTICFYSDKDQHGVDHDLALICEHYYKLDKEMVREWVDTLKQNTIDENARLVLEKLTYE